MLFAYAGSSYNVISNCLGKEKKRLLGQEGGGGGKGGGRKDECVCVYVCVSESGRSFHRELFYLITSF